MYSAAMYVLSQNYIQRSESLVVNDINDSTIPLVGLQSCKSPGEPHLRKSI